MTKKKIKIVADNGILFLKGVLEEYADILYLPSGEITSQNIKDADAIIVRTRTKCDKNLLENTKVRFIATGTMGYDHIDADYCQSKNIKWINAPGCNANSVLQYMASALLILAERMKMNLLDKTIGIIGVGNIGQKVERFANLLGMKVLLNDPPQQRKEGNSKFVDINYLIEQSDIITLHVPLNLDGIDKTYHMANESFFSRFNYPKIFINTSRGEVVQSSALKDAFRENLVSAYVLDVWEDEPNIDLELLHYAALATPHIAGYSVEGKANGTAVCVNELNKFFNLGLKANWYPSSLPKPDKSNEINVHCKGKSLQEIFFECITHTYNITEDDKNLRISPSQFEQQRINYPIRREFYFYKVRLINADSQVRDKIKEIGFNLI